MTRIGTWTSMAVAAVIVGAPGLCRGTVPSGALDRIVTGVTFECPTSVDTDDFGRHLAVQTGEPLTETALRESIEWLRSKEIFTRVEADVDLTVDGVLVTFHLEPADFIVGVEIEGVDQVPEGEILRRARLREDERISEARMATAEERLQTFYTSRGYRDAEISIRTRSVRPGRAVVVIHVVEGDPVRLERLSVNGLSAIESAEATEALDFSDHEPFGADLPQTARDRLIRYFRARSHYEIDVRESHTVEDKRAVLELDVRIGPRFEIRVEGNERVSRDRLLGLTDLAGRPIITDGTWRVLARRMEEHYQQQGYRFASVSADVRHGDPTVVAFQVDEGPRVYVEAILFEAVTAASPSELQSLMETRPASSWWPFTSAASWFDEARLTDDLDRLRDFYGRQGYPDMKVREVRRLYSDDRRRVTLVLALDEGLPRRVASVDVSDEEGLLSERPSLKLRPGTALDPDLLEEDRRSLVTALGALGYPNGAVASDVTERSAATGIEVDILHRIDAGDRVTVGDVLIQHNYFTRDRVIRREIPLEAGDPFDPAALTQAQRNLYRLGLFRSVALEPVPAEPGKQDVRARVVERPGGEIQYGFGYNTRSGLRSFLQIGHRNLMGTGRPVSARGEINLSPDDFTPDEYLVNADAREPRIGDTEYDLRTNLVFQQSERSVDEFSIHRFSFASGFEREFLPGLQLSALLEFEESRIFDVAPDAVLTGQDVGRLRIVSLNPILVHEGRDDSFAPTRGTFETLRIRYATPALGSDVHLVKANVQHSQYVPLGDGWTFIYAVRTGLAESLESSTVPIRERFFLGGRTSVRGFDENEIGPLGENGNPVGGDFLVNGNLEIRFPFLWGVGGAAFLDGGGLYLRGESISIDDFRESAGPGLRYQTPIGSISLDYGFKLDRRDGESIGEVHFTIGNIF